MAGHAALQRSSRRLPRPGRGKRGIDGSAAVAGCCDPCSLRRSSGATHFRCQKNRTRSLTLRITREERESTSIVRGEGRLVCEAVRELRKVRAEPKRRRVLALSNVQSADREGICALRELREGGAALEGVDGYIRFLLDGDGGRGSH